MHMWLCRTYTDMAGEEVAKKYQTLIFLAGSASAEFFADIALCPFEAVKVGAEVASQMHVVQQTPLYQLGYAPVTVDLLLSPLAGLPGTQQLLLACPPGVACPVQEAVLGSMHV